MTHPLFNCCGPNRSCKCLKSGSSQAGYMVKKMACEIQCCKKQKYLLLKKRHTCGSPPSCH